MPNLIASPRFWKNKALLLKSEVTVGTDSVPTGAANWIEARNVSITPMDAETEARNIEQPWLGRGGTIQVAQYVKVGFEVALTGSGAAGTAPKFAPALLACAMAETLVASTSAAYNLVSAAMGAVSIYLNIDGTVHKLVGSRGTWTVRINAKKIPVLAFEFESAYIAPAAQAMPAVTKTGWQIEEAVNGVNSTAIAINGVNLAFSAFEVAVGNQIARLDLPGPQTECAITDRAPTSSVTVLAPALATFDPFALAKAGTNVTVSTTHGSAAGKKAKVDLKAVLTGVEYDQIEGMAAYRIAMEPTPVAGNDEIALTFL